MLAPVKSFICTEDTPVVQTRAGKLRGMILDGVYSFRGVRYAEAERFMSPKPVSPWEGVVDAQDYGYVSPILNTPRFRGDIVGPHRYWASSEHCQYLNVWTDKLDPQAKKPVLFWIHGGGFSDGSSIEMYAYEGENLARDKDVVVVSVNHRLNILGYLDLSDYGPEFSHSGVVGMEDLVEALRWVHENIAQFGGDPENVTIFGQSGGGGKVQVLMQMPSADGLYQRAIIQSGVLSSAMNVTKAQAQTQAKAIVEAIGGIDNLRSKDYFYLAEAVHAVEAQGVRVGWGAVPGCGDYADLWYDTGFRPETAQIPVMVGSTLSDFAFGSPARLALANKAALTEEERRAAVRETYGDAADEIAALFEAGYPGVNLYYATAVDTMVRVATMEYIAARSAAVEAPVFAFMVAHESVFKGGTMSRHCDEIPFVFRNDAGIGAVHGADAAIDAKLREELSGAWVNFARSGNPSGGVVPRWTPYTDDCHATFVFCDTVSETRIDHDTELVKLVQKHAPIPPFFAAPMEKKDKK